jgi:hypothetical protein
MHIPDQAELDSMISEHEKWLKSGGKRGAQADFSDMIIRQAAFRDSNLKKAIFWGTDLGNTSFMRTNLHGANFCKADLWGVRFWDLDMREADFCGADLRTTHIQNARLDEVVVASGETLLNWDSMELLLEILRQNTGRSKIKASWVAAIGESGRNFHGVHLMDGVNKAGRTWIREILSKYAHTPEEANAVEWLDFGLGR